MRKPSWKDAPPWANYIARQPNGRWWWYELEPERMTELNGWIPSDWSSQYCEARAYGWDTSVESKPKE